MSRPDSEELIRDPERGPINWITAAVAVVLAGFQLYEGLGPTGAASTPAAPSTFLGVLLLSGVVIFFTDYWRPSLYLVGALVGLYVIVVWVVGETALDPASLGTALSAALLVGLCLIVFYREQVVFLEDPRESRLS